MIRHWIRRNYALCKTHWLYLSADDHIGHPAFDEKLWREQHEEAKEKDAICLKIGDVFEAIPQSDPRHTMSNDEYLVNDYHQEALDRAEDLFEPYVNNFYMISPGNHEDSNLRHYHNDLIRDLVRRMNSKRNRVLPPIKEGDYRGFFKIKFGCASEEGAHSRVKPFLIFYDHGKGGGGEVTDGAITLQRYSTWIAADLIVTAHIHGGMIKPLPAITTVNHRDNIVNTPRMAIILSTFKKTLIMSEEIGTIDELKEIKNSDGAVSYEQQGRIRGGYKSAFEERKLRTPRYKLGGCFVRLDVNQREDIKITVEMRGEAAEHG